MACQEVLRSVQWTQPAWQALPKFPRGSLCWRTSDQVKKPHARGFWWRIAIFVTLKHISIRQSDFVWARKTVSTVFKHKPGLHGRGHLQRELSEHQGSDWARSLGQISAQRVAYQAYLFADAGNELYSGNCIWMSGGSAEILVWSSISPLMSKSFTKGSAAHCLSILRVLVPDLPAG